MQLSREQVIQLAPDDSSAKAGVQLARSTAWVARFSHNRAIWGDCQGSGKLPYKTMVDLENLAFKCSCPSRKFPCKHGLGLLLLFVQESTIFVQETDLAPAVAEWLDKRAERADSKEKKADKAPDEAGVQKRQQSREKKVNSGMEELRTWIKDTVRTGIMGVPQNPYKFKENIVARMVDSQAGGLASKLRAIDKINFYQEGWQTELTRLLSGVFLLTEAYRNIGDEEALRQEILTQVGWNMAKEDVLQGPAIKDQWLVFALYSEDEGNLTTEYVWLYGLETKHMALLLNFYAGKQVSQHALTYGLLVNADLVFYPSPTPLRALINEQRSTSITLPELNGINNIREALDLITEKIAVNPFCESIPFFLNDVFLSLNNGKWYLTDDSEQSITLIHNNDRNWKILGACAGKKFNCFVIYRKSGFEILSLVHEQKLLQLV